MDESNVNPETTNKLNEFSDKENARTVSPPPPSDTTSDFVEINNESSLSQSENQIKGLLDDSIGNDTIDEDDDDDNHNHTGPATPSTTPTQNEDDSSDLLSKSNLITASTLVITTSQIIDDLNKSCVEIDDMDINMNDESKTSDDSSSNTKEETSAELNAAVDAVIASVSATVTSVDSTNDDDEDDTSQQTIITNKTRDENEEEPEQLELKNSSYEARNSIDLIVESQEELSIKEDETGLHKSCVDLGNLGKYIYENNKKI